MTLCEYWQRVGCGVVAAMILMAFGQITFTANPGREYDERNLRIGVRLMF